MPEPPGGERSADEREAARLARERARAERAARASDRDAGRVEFRHVREDPLREAREADRDLAPEETAGWDVRPPVRRLRRARGARPPAGAPPGEPPRDEPPGAGRTSARHGRRRIVALAVLGVALLVAAWFLVSLFQPFKGDGDGLVAVTVPRGAGAGQIGDVLEAKGVVSSSFFFRLRTTLSGHRGDLKPGIYNLRRGMSYAAAIDALTKGPSPNLVNVTLPEGLSRREAAARIRSTGLRGNYLAATKRSRLLDPRRYGARHASDLEGFLFPATYQLRKPASVRTLVGKQLAAFRQNFAKVDLRAARKANLTAYDVLTIASLVEREAQVDRERPLVASVVYNRLRRGMQLDIDATVRFVTGNWTRPLTQSQLNTASPYNTRRSPGLPPGPIGSPGLASIEAAAHPAHTSYLFYVVKPGKCGEHAFSSTDAQFQRDVQRYNSARAARGGKSPTTC